MSNAKSVFETMVDRFNSEEADGMEAVFQFEIDSSDSFYIEIEDDKCSLTEGEHDDATVTLSMELETLKGIMSDELDGMDAFMQGKIQADGDIMLATKLTQLFPN